MAARRAATWAV
jgi:hypothetical protein